ncbi:plasma membrane localization protein [Microbotryomycetes sp. JL201]|nr:plasma membrane localization protein [Microbotryomycetes sp. JL201]
MGLLPTPNHQKLIRAVYPPPNELGQDPPAGPVSNALGKLTFYASGRPKKLPKVCAVLLERAERDGRPSSGAKARGGLSVTLQAMTALVTEARTEWNVTAKAALRAAEIGLLRRNGAHRDVHLEANAAQLASRFAAVATMASGVGPSVDEATSKQYTRCLALVSSLAQLGPQDTASRMVALEALNAAVRSELLYSSTYGYDSQIEEIVPGLLYNCLDSSTDELNQAHDVSDAEAHTSNLPQLEHRRAPPVNAPESAPSSKDLATEAVKALRTATRLSNSAQLYSKLTATGSWLDRYKNGSLWKQTQFIEWLGTSVISASAVQYRAGVVSWWVEQVVEVNDSEASAKAQTLLQTLSQILRGPTTLVGLGIGSVLSQLAGLAIERASFGEDDPLGLPLLDTIASLATSHIYYVDQLNDVVTDLIEDIKRVKEGEGRTGRPLSRSERKRAMRRLVGALKAVLVQADKCDGKVQVAVPVNQSESDASANGDVNGNANSDGGELRGKKDSPTDALGRPLVRIKSAGQRAKVAPEVFAESLFLMTDVDAAVRQEYQRAVLFYIERELAVARPSPKDDLWEPSHQLERFARELHVAVYELATSQNLGPAVMDDFGADESRSTVTHTRRSSKSSRRRSMSSSRPGGQSLANASDYAAMVAIVRALQLRQSIEAVTEGTPALLALQTNGEQWENSENQGRERAQACREIAAEGIQAIGEAWGISEVGRLATQVLSKLDPSVLPNLHRKKGTTSADFAHSASSSRASLPVQAVLDALTSSSRLQQAGGAGLATQLVAPWSPEVAQRKKKHHIGSLSNGGGRNRSMTNLSSLRVGSPDRPTSIRAPSLADMQSSLGQPTTSARNSKTPSLASTSNTVATSTHTQRRTARAKAETVLNRLSVSKPGVPKTAPGISPSPSPFPLPLQRVVYAPQPVLIQQGANPPYTPDGHPPPHPDPSQWSQSAHPAAHNNWQQWQPPDPRWNQAGTSPTVSASHLPPNMTAGHSAPLPGNLSPAAAPQPTLSPAPTQSSHPTLSAHQGNVSNNDVPGVVKPTSGKGSGKKRGPYKKTRAKQQQQNIVEETTSISQTTPVAIVLPAPQSAPPRMQKRPTTDDPNGPAQTVMLVSQPPPKRSSKSRKKPNAAEVSILSPEDAWIHTKKFTQGLNSENTINSYKSLLRRWTEWTSRLEGEPHLKAGIDKVTEHSPAAILRYASHQYRVGKWAATTVDVFRSAVSWHYTKEHQRLKTTPFEPTTATGHPLCSQECIDFFAMVKKEGGRNRDAKRLTALSVSHLQQIIDTHPTNGPLMSAVRRFQNAYRRALFALGFFAWLRVDELCKLRMTDFQFDQTDGHGRKSFLLHLGLRKTNQTDATRTFRMRCPENQPEGPAFFEIITEYKNLLLARLPADCRDNRNLRFFPAFRNEQWDLQPGQELSKTALNILMQQTFEQAGVDYMDLQYTGHYLRRGGAQWRFIYARRKWSLHACQQWGGWTEQEHQETIVKYLLANIRTQSTNVGDILDPEAFEGRALYQEPPAALVDDKTVRQIIYDEVQAYSQLEASNRNEVDFATSATQRGDAMEAPDEQSPVSAGAHGKLFLVQAHLARQQDEFQGRTSEAIAALQKLCSTIVVKTQQMAEKMQEKEQVSPQSSLHGRDRLRTRQRERRRTLLHTAPVKKSRANRKHDDATFRRRCAEAEIPIPDDKAPTTQTQTAKSWTEYIDQWFNGSLANGRIALKDWPATWQAQNAMGYGIRRTIATAWELSCADDPSRNSEEQTKAFREKYALQSDTCTEAINRVRAWNCEAGRSKRRKTAGAVQTAPAAVAVTVATA